ncbi:MAG: glycosyltransferase family 4 protein [Fimbriimonas sp.]
MSDRDDYRYPASVTHEIQAEDVDAYELAAGYINRRNYDVLSIQHEFGIFGGKAGSYLMNLIRHTRVPVVTTLHTVLPDPSNDQKEVMNELLHHSARIVVMSQRAVTYLLDVHGISPAKVDLIPHGIPVIPKASSQAFRAGLGIDGPMILTFGLLSPDKGIQYAIEAMPKILAHSPKAVYIILGATHPTLKANSGEAYRESLVKLVTQLEIQESVRFIDRFVPTEELVEYLGAMDIYITPYLNPRQITSGTLAYAVGSGKAVISTPYAYAEELLADGRGMLVPFRDADAIAEAVIQIEGDHSFKEGLGLRAAEFGEKMVWPEVGRSYIDTFERARQSTESKLQRLVDGPLTSLPEMRLEHLLDLTDDTGIFQHATYTVPNRSEGYCVDDNARALLLTACLERSGPLPEGVFLLQSRYLSFVMDAYNPLNGRFRNFMSYRREWLEEAGSEDSHGRAMWGLGSMVHHCRDRGRRDAAKAVFKLGRPQLAASGSLRTWAYGILALDEYLHRNSLDLEMRALLDVLSSRLQAALAFHHSDDWPWFEDILTYANARLPQALIVAGIRLGNRLMINSGLESLRWLLNHQTGAKKEFSPIGSNGFFPRLGEKAMFDQQPVEAWATVSACITAAECGSGSMWMRHAESAFNWFLGENQLSEPLYDRLSGGCHDGLHPDRVNRNQGAESTLSFLCALDELRVARVRVKEFGIELL